MRVSRVGENGGKASANGSGGESEEKGKPSIRS